ncbi:GntR family transcriptional regulator [Candidatus Frankia alpina]|uniref:GntR family transcriptional regulator n=1 Tax=Candidatus Frankia alpina TaxID=2699483 RepID=UPI0013D58F3C|nr:GntR family transcriptional regulator [Candidatus Frankia alpina]
MTQPAPAYARIISDIRDRIIRGDLQPGDLVPSEQSIVNTWGVSRGTVVRALAELRAEGLIETVPGVGTRVLATTAQGGSDRARRLKTTGSIFRPDETSTITGAGIVDAPADIGAALGIEPGTPVIRRTRLLSDRDGIAAISTSWLPAEFADAVPALLQPRSLGGTGTLRAVAVAVADATGRTAVLCRETSVARLADEAESTTLDLPAPAAVLETRSLFTDHAGDAIEYGVDIAPSRRTRTVEIALA